MHALQVRSLQSIRSPLGVTNFDTLYVLPSILAAEADCGQEKKGLRLAGCSCGDGNFINMFVGWRFTCGYHTNGQDLMCKYSALWWCTWDNPSHLHLPSYMFQRFQSVVLSFPMHSVSDSSWFGNTIVCVSCFRGGDLFSPHPAEHHTPAGTHSLFTQYVSEVKMAHGGEKKRNGMTKLKNCHQIADTRHMSCFSSTWWRNVFNTFVGSILRSRKVLKAANF